MPFELSNIPVSFQSYINKILAKKLNVFIIVYLDDILIYIKNASQAYVDAIYWTNWGNTAFLPILKSVVFIKMRFNF